MTVTVKASRKIISGSGWVNPLTHDFYLEASSHLHVYADGVELTSGVDYSVAGVLDVDGYEVTVTTPGDWDPDVWVLSVTPPISQGNDVSLGGTFGARFEDALDALTRRVQSIYDIAIRAVVVPRTTPVGEEPPTSEEIGEAAADAIAAAVETAADRAAVDAALVTAAALVGSGAADWTSIGGIVRSNKDELGDFGRLVTRFGAVHDNIVDDAPAVQEAVDIGSGRVLFPDGTYRMVPGDVSPYTFGNAASVPVHRAVAVTEDDTTFSGKEAVVHAVSRSGVAAGDVQPVFATEKNMTLGAIDNITFDGMTFDPENAADLVNSNQRFAYMVGVDGLRYLNTIAHSSGPRRGYFSHIQNSQNVQVNGHRHDTVTGGFNLRYVHDFVMTNFIFDDFSEAIDLDGTSDRVVIRSGSFKSTARTTQCIDINSQIDASIGDFSVYGVGNIATINHKTTTHATFADYVADGNVENFVVSKRIIISNITGKEIGTSTAPSFFLGWDWSAGSLAGSGPVTNITIQNVDLEDTSWMQIREASKLVMSNINLKDVIVPASTWAVQMFSSTANADQIGWSDLDAKIRDMRIEGSQRGGLRLATASRADVNGLVTQGNNTLGGSDADLIIAGLHTRAGRAIVDNSDIEGVVILSGDSTTIGAWAADTFYKRYALVTNDTGKFYQNIAEGYSAAAGGPTGTGLNILDDGSATAASWAGSTAYVVDDVVENGAEYFICMTAGTSAASGGPSGDDDRIYDGTAVWRPVAGAASWKYLDRPYSVMWGKNNRVRGTVTLQGDAHKWTYGEQVSAYFGDLAATGTVILPILSATRRGLVTGISYVTAADVVAHATNFRTVLVRRYRAGVATTIGTISTASTGFTAFVPRDGGVTASPAGAYLEPGDIVVMNSAHAASGVAITGLAATLRFIEF